MPISFGPESFSTPSDDQVQNIYNLANENLFPKERVMFSRRNRVYSALMPSFLLASRIILSKPQTFNLFVARKCHQGFVEQEDIIHLDPETLISKIRDYIPNIDLDPDMAARGEEYGMTQLMPSAERDLLLIDYALIKAVLDKGSGKRRTTTALAYIAILLCHELAHVLEFRFIRKGSFREDGEPFESPPGLTCTEAGISWEKNTFGGSISPVSPGSDLMSIIGLSIQSSKWRYLHMPLSYAWINGLFNENFWAGQASPRLIAPYNPHLALSSTFTFDEDEESLMGPCTPTKYRQVRDVKVALYKTPTGSAQPSKVNTKAIYARRTCGGKKICLSGPPLWPFNDAAKRTAPAPDHPHLTGEQIENATVPNPGIDGLAAADKRSLPNLSTPSLPVVDGEGELILSSNGSSNLPREN